VKTPGQSLTGAMFVSLEYSIWIFIASGLNEDLMGLGGVIVGLVVGVKVSLGIVGTFVSGEFVGFDVVGF